MRTLRVFVVMLFAILLCAASKPHVVGFGSPQSVKLFFGPSEDKTMDLSVRALYVDTKLKEFTVGKPHEVTDREFVVRRAFRINDALPDDPQKSPKWLWQLGGWLLVNRSSGKVTLLKLPDFDPFYSEVSWYRDYAAYCGLSSNGERLLAVVAEIGVKKPLYRKELGKGSGGDLPDSDCSPPPLEPATGAGYVPPQGGREVYRKRQRELCGCFAGILRRRAVSSRNLHLL